MSSFTRLVSYTADADIQFKIVTFCNPADADADVNALFMPQARLHARADVYASSVTAADASCGSSCCSSCIRALKSPFSALNANNLKKKREDPR